MKRILLFTAREGFKSSNVMSMDNGDVYNDEFDMEMMLDY